MKYSILPFLLSFLIFSCKLNTTNNITTNEHPSKPITSTPTNNLVTYRMATTYDSTFDAGNYKIFVSAKSQEITTLKLSTKGLENEYNEVFQLEGKLKNAYLLDLNKDGFKELYVAFNDNSGRINIFGIAANKDKSMSQLTVEDASELRKENSDKVFIENNQLYRTFETPNEVFVKYTFKLTKGETSYILKAVKL